MRPGRQAVQHLITSPPLRTPTTLPVSRTSKISPPRLCQSRRMSLRTFVLVSLIAIPWLAGCGKATPPPTAASLPAVPVKVYTIQDKAHPTTEELLGTVRAELRAAIEAKVTGRIEKMLAAPGRSFQAGELIAQLDHRDSQARYDQAVAIRDQAVRDDARFQRLIGPGDGCGL